MVWTRRRGRCWATARGLGRRVALGHVPKTLGASYPASELCRLSKVESANIKAPAVEITAIHRSPRSGRRPLGKTPAQRGFVDFYSTFLAGKSINKPTYAKPADKTCCHQPAVFQCKPRFTLEMLRGLRGVNLPPSSLICMGLGGVGGRTWRRT